MTLNKQQKTEVAQLWVGFETILPDPKVKSVVLFSEDRKRSIKISRIAKNSGSFRVTMGRLAYDERQYLKTCKRNNTDPDNPRVEYVPKRPKRA